ncbi:MAG TPA: ATP12 family protein [Xanthobacteraceae bacterium]|jgi:chaperone required for assembly of F1-ATPase
MRDVFEDIFTAEPIDPTEAARRAVRPTLRKRFYRTVGLVEQAEGFVIVLDERPVRTPARRPLAAPTRALGEALAVEWDARTEVIDPAKMPLTRLANTIIDGVAAARPEIAAEIERYLGSDLIYYRAEAPDALVARQAQHWDPILAFARDDLSARFVITQGVNFVTQPTHAIAAARRVIPDDAWRLGAVHSVMTLTGSALIALALARGALAADAAWTAAHVDEDWNIEQWGHDELAQARRAARFAEMQAAVCVLELAR